MIGSKNSFVSRWFGEPDGHPAAHVRRERVVRQPRHHPQPGGAEGVGLLWPVQEGDRSAGPASQIRRKHQPHGRARVLRPGQGAARGAAQVEAVPAAGPERRPDAEPPRPDTNVVRGPGRGDLAQQEPGEGVDTLEEHVQRAERVQFGQRAPAAV